NDDERRRLIEFIANTESAMTLERSTTLKRILIQTAIFFACLVAMLIAVKFAVDQLTAIIIALTIGVPLLLAQLYCLLSNLFLLMAYWDRFTDCRHFQRNEVPKIQKAIEVGQVFVEQVTVNAVIELCEFHEDGPGYIYDVGEGKILFVKGRCYLPADST